MLEDFVQGYSNQVKDMIEAQKGTIHKSIKFAVYCYIN